MVYNPSAMEKLKKWIPNIILIFVGIGMALGIVVLGLRFLPQNKEKRVASVDLGVTKFYAGMGNTFANHPGWIAPPEDPYEVLSEHRLAWDADGFRIPTTPSQNYDGTYDVLALGDSFTEGANVAVPWPDALDNLSGLAVRNMGYRGYGPIEELHVMQEFGPQSNAQYVIVAFYGGNDLSNAESHDDRPRVDLPALTRGLFKDEFDSRNWKFEYDYPPPYRYPMQIDLNGTDHDVIFIEGYIWEHARTYETIAASEGVALTIETWQEIDALSDACTIIAYFPSKEHIYMPYLKPEFHADMVYRSEEGISFEELVKRLPNQRNVIRDKAVELGFPFVDVTPAYEAATANGDIIFYTYDTHINQLGHTIASQVIADFLAINPCNIT